MILPGGQQLKCRFAIKAQSLHLFSTANPLLVKNMAFIHLQIIRKKKTPRAASLSRLTFYLASPNQVPLPGYYNLADRGAQLIEQLSQADTQWDTQNSQAVQLGERTGYAQRLLKPLLADLNAIARGNEEKKLIKQLSTWQGNYPIDSYLPTLFTEFSYQLLKAAMLDELGETVFSNVLRTRIIDSALP